MNQTLSAKKLTPPREPIIPADECHGALVLMRRMCDNIVESGVVSDGVWEFAAKTSDAIRALNVRPSDSQLEVVSAAMSTGMLPTSHHRSTVSGAGTALLNLIRANAEAKVWEEDKAFLKRVTSGGN